MSVLKNMYRELCIFLCLTFLVLCLSGIYNYNYDVLYQYKTIINLLNLKLMFGIDGISLVFLLLTSVVIPLSMLYIWNSNNHLYSNFYSFITLLSIEILLILVFSSLDLIVFYIIFEFLLVPFYYIIVLNNTIIYTNFKNFSNRKMNAFFLLFFYTITGSLLMLLGIITIKVHLGHTFMPLLFYSTWKTSVEYLLWITFFFSLGIKIPIVPTHLWLLEAHVESPTEGSVILASILLKIGLYGVIRIILPAFKDATIFFSIYVWIICIISIIYTSLSAFVQVDLKRIFAYASIGHMNLCLLGFFLLDIYSINGSIILMFSHGLTSAGLFFASGILYNRYHSKNVKCISASIHTMPLFSVLFLIITISNFSIPGTFNFIGEFYIFITVISQNSMYLILAIVFSNISASFYSIYIYNKVTFGNINTYNNWFFTDINLIEFSILAILCFINIYLGIFPTLLSSFFEQDVALFCKCFIV